MNLRRTTSLSLVLAVAALTPAAALAKNGADDSPNTLDDNGGQRLDDNRDATTQRGKRVRGRCSGGATSKLKVKPDNGRLETEFEVDQNRAGVTWKVRIRHDGKLALRRSATTKAPSGSFSVKRPLRNGAGSDRISARATSPSGQVCRASLTI
jgi:hypothetical protein